MIFRSSVLRWERRGPRVLAFSILTSLPFLRSCGGAGKRRGFDSGVRVIGCPRPLARAVWSSPGGEGRSGHCFNHRHRRHSRSRRSLGRWASVSEQRLPWNPDADWGATLGLLRAEPDWAPARNRRAWAAADPTLCTVPRPSPAFHTRNSLGLCGSLATMPRATALGALGPLLLLLLPLPRDAEGLGERSDAASDYSALEGEEGAEQQLEHYHDPCKAGRCRRAGEVRQKFAFEMQMRWWASLRCRLWGGSPLPSREVPRAPRENNAPEEGLNATRAGTSGPPVCGALGWRPWECFRSESGRVPEAERALRAGAGARAA